MFQAFGPDCSLYLLPFGSPLSDCDSTTDDRLWSALQGLRVTKGDDKLVGSDVESVQHSHMLAHARGFRKHRVYGTE